MMDGLIDGTMKGMYIFGENTVESDPNIHHVRKALTSAEFLVVQEIFLTRTAELADVVLPGASWGEVEGTYTNTERKVQRIRKAVEPPGEARPNWVILSEIGRRLGLDNMTYASAEEVFNEMASLTPSFAGITYDRIDTTDIQWPCPSAGPSRHPSFSTRVNFQGERAFSMPFRTAPTKSFRTKNIRSSSPREDVMHTINTRTHDRQMQGRYTT